MPPISSPPYFVTRNENDMIELDSNTIVASFEEVTPQNQQSDHPSLNHPSEEDASSQLQFKLEAQFGEESQKGASQPSELSLPRKPLLSARTSIPKISGTILTIIT